MTPGLAAGLAVIAAWILVSRIFFERVKKEVDARFAAMEEIWDERRHAAEDLYDLSRTFRTKEQEYIFLIGALLKRALREDDRDFRIGTESALGIFLRSFRMRLSEYPAVYENELFQKEDRRLEEIRSRMAVICEDYNRSAARFNNLISSFPGVFIRDLFHYKPAALYELEEEQEDYCKVAF